MSNTLIEVPQEFDTKLKPGRWNCIRLYEAGGGGRAATIDIVKEIWLDIGNKQPEPFKGKQHPVFYVYNYVDPSKMFNPGWSGCCVHDSKKPFTTLSDALGVAEEHAAMAIASGKWVRFGDLDPARRAELKRFDGVCEQFGISVVLIA